MKTRRWILILLILSCSLSLLTGCKFGGKDLLIHEVDGKFYVEFAKNYDEKTVGTLGCEIELGSMLFPSVWFPSMAVLQKGFLEGKLTESAIRQFQWNRTKEEHGYPIPDLINMYEPVVPADVRLYSEVELGIGTSYSFNCEWGNYSGSISFGPPYESGQVVEQLNPAGDDDIVEEIFYREQRAKHYICFRDGEVSQEVYLYTVEDRRDTLYVRETYYQSDDGGTHMVNLRFNRVSPSGENFLVSFSKRSSKTPHEELWPEITLEWLTGFNSKAYPYVPGREINPEEWDLSPGYHGVKSLKE